MDKTTEVSTKTEEASSNVAVKSPKVQKVEKEEADKTPWMFILKLIFLVCLSVSLGLHFL